MRALAVIACVSVVATAAAVHAETASEARFFDDLARREYAARRFGSALDAFLSVHALAPGPGSTYNVALCAELAQRPELAFAFLARYVRAPDEDADRRLDAQRRLEALRSKLALVDVVTKPEGARIVVDREELGSYGEAPRTVAVDAGEHVVIATLDGFRPARVNITAASGTTSKVELTLEQILGELEVELTPPGATLRIERDGVPMALPLPADPSRLRVPVGRYTLRIEAAGHVPSETSVLVTESSKTRVALIAQPIPPRTGQLLVDTGSTVARLFVDGKAVALTPATLTDVVAGPHAIRLVAEGKTPWSANVVVKEGAPAYVNATLLDEGAQR